MIRFRTTDGARVAFNPRGKVEAVTSSDEEKTTTVTVVTTDATGKTSWTWALDTGQPDWVDTLTALLNLLETP